MEENPKDDAKHEALNLPRIALEHLEAATAESKEISLSPLEHAEISQAATLLMISERVSYMNAELRQLRAILTKGRA